MSDTAAAPATSKGWRFLGITLGHAQNMIFLTQVVFFCLFGGCTQFDGDYNITSNGQTGTPNTLDATTGATDYKHLFIGLFVFLGLGFSYIQNNKSPLQSLAFPLALGATAVEWAILLIGFWDNAKLTRTTDVTGWPPIPLNYTILINALYIAATIIISYGAIAGRVSFGQAYAIAFFEVFVATANFKIMEEERVNDFGGTMFIHLFGATFGLVVSWMLPSKPVQWSVNSPRSRDVVVFGFIGTLLLFILYPIFNSANVQYVVYQAAGADANALANVTRVSAALSLRSYFNTTMAVISSVAGAYLFSRANSLEGDKFNIWQIQTAATAGGAAIAATAPMLKNPWGALMTGALVGVVTAWAQTYITPALAKVRMYDTTGVFAAHWVPGFIGIFASAIAIARVTEGEDYAVVQRNALVFNNRSALQQGGHQIAFGLITIFIAAIWAALVGLVVGKIFLFEPKFETSTFDEEEFEGLAGVHVAGAAAAAASAAPSKTEAAAEPAADAAAAPAVAESAAAAPKVDAPAEPEAASA